jgi:hypothetical protein
VVRPPLLLLVLEVPSLAGRRCRLPPPLLLQMHWLP